MKMVVHGTLHSVIWYILNDVSEKLTASILSFRLPALLHMRVSANACMHQ
jgi:hypothetical protein